MSSVTVEELDALVKHLFSLRTKADEQEEVVKAINKEITETESKIVSYMKELDRDKYSAPEGTISVRQQWRWTLPKTPEDREAFFNQLKERGIFDSMITVNSQTYNSFLKAEFEAAQAKGEALGFKFPGVPEPTLFERAYVRKANQE